MNVDRVIILHRHKYPSGPAMYTVSFQTPPGKAAPERVTTTIGGKPYAGRVISYDPATRLCGAQLFAVPEARP